MPTVETILNKGFSNGQPWDRTAVRRAMMLWLLPVCAVVIAVAGYTYYRGEAVADYPVGYVVSNDSDCTLVLAERPDGPPVETVRQNSGGRLGSCGGLDENQAVYYDPGTGQQTFGTESNVVGIVASLVAAALAGVPGALAWTATLQKREARRRPGGAGG
ncbi:hypothetical protein ENKNEFLB_03417 [Nocardioides aquaticus]|uniref:DUF3592 domain-containing protein n=1 Tax=Nocardioides aquaticus TaxID=160826 RepID=A0ABX8EKF7_9ACTN|nr:hypothetical protein ENKNEFLB_03417 [Nocardioides aquaticus]